MRRAGGRKVAATSGGGMGRPKLDVRPGVHADEDSDLYRADRSLLGGDGLRNLVGPWHRRVLRRRIRPGDDETITHDSSWIRVGRGHSTAGHVDVSRTVEHNGILPFLPKFASINMIEDNFHE